MPTPPRELSAEQLRRLCSPDEMTFGSQWLTWSCWTTSSARNERRVRSSSAWTSHLRLQHLRPRSVGRGKTTTITQYLERKAATLPIPNDWAYVNDFERPDEPKALRLPPGGGVRLRDRFDQLLHELEELLPKAFESENYEQHRKEMVEELDVWRQEIVEKMEMAALQGFVIVETPTGPALCTADRRQGCHSGAVRAASGGTAEGT